MRSLFFFPLLLCLLFSCSNDGKSGANQANITSPELAQILADYHKERMSFYPIEATFAGEAGYNDQLPIDISEEYRGKLREFYRKYEEKLATINRSKLSPEERISQEVLDWECKINFESLIFQTNLIPINQFSAMHLNLGQLAGGEGAQPFKTVEDYDNWIKRLDAFLVWMDVAMSNMREGMAKNITLQKPLALKTIPQFADLAKGTVQEHLYFKPILAMPATFSEADKTRLNTVYTEMVGKKLMPKFAQMATFLEKEYVPKCRTATATALGMPYYAGQVRTYTTTDMSFEDVFQLGQAEVARLTAEMEKVKEEVGFKGDLKAFFDHVRNRKELMPFTKPEEVVANFNAIHEKMKPQLSKLFDKTPKTAFEVRRTEAFREASASAEYMQGSLDGTRPGIFYVPIPDVAKYNVFSDEDLFLHEAIPGHHYQISLQQENVSLPDFRRTLWYSSYGEGWALYCESLGKEVGLYQDPYQYFGMLSAEMHRAIRLVVDVGMHAKGWTREQAIQYSLDHEAESEESITAEIERYMAWPGQALSYKVGQLKIRELRAKAQAQQGEKFDIKQFHNAVLESGCLPLQVLERKVLGEGK